MSFYEAEEINYAQEDTTSIFTLMASALAIAVFATFVYFIFRASTKPVLEASTNIEDSVDLSVVRNDSPLINR